VSNWSHWVDTLSIKKSKNQYTWPGVYKIRLADADGHPIEIGRLLCKDKEGTLAIGESKNIATRINQFNRAQLKGKLVHSEGITLFLIRMLTKFSRGLCNDCRIQFSAKKLKGKKEAEREEEKMLKTYFIEYGELPPLNRNMPDFRVTWLSLVDL
jgi:hypothetical protein